MQDPYGTGSLYLSPQQELTNDDVASTGVRTDENGYWQIVLQMDDEGTQEVAKLSAELVKSRKPLAFLIDGELLCAPVTSAPVTNGIVPISSADAGFSAEDARRIAKGIVAE